MGSFGEGPAYYQMEVMKLGEVTNYTSYDSSPFYTLDGSGESEEGKVSIAGSYLFGICFSYFP